MAKWKKGHQICGISINENNDYNENNYSNINREAIHVKIEVLLDPDIAIPLHINKTATVRGSSKLNTSAKESIFILNTSRLLLIRLAKYDDHELPKQHPQLILKEYSQQQYKQ